jgi:probable F420-dependent oxidoreductase
MKFGLSLSGISPRHYSALSQQAERLGYESVWIPDHLVFPEVMPPTYLYSETGEPPINSKTAVYDPWVLLGGIATVTESIRMATNVYVLPLRHPITTARGVLTVDRISRGRITLGVGVGWLTEEFGLVGLDASNRGKRTDEIIPLLRRLWTEEIIEHHGEYYDLDPVYFEPKPFQRPIPIEVGGTSPAALRRAGRLGDGWIAIGIDAPDELQAALDVVQRHRKEADRGDLPFVVTTNIFADADVAEIERLADLGVDRAILRLPVRDRVIDGPELADLIAAFAENVVSRSGS